MRDETNKTKRTALFGRLALLCAAVGLIAVLVMTFFAVRATGGDYRALRDADLSGGFRGTLSYNDRLYAQLGGGIEIEKDESDKDTRMTAYLESSVRRIDERVCAAGLIYTMMIVIVLSLFLAVRFGQRRGRHLLAIALSTAGIYALFLATTAGLFALYGVPFYLPGGEALMMLGVSLASIVGGACALGLVLRSVRHKTAVAVLAVPLGVALIISGMLVEGGLFAVPTLPSFDYVYEIYPPEENEDMYYDDAQNVMVVGDKTFPPEEAPNPVRYTGAAFAAGAAYEAVNPFSGNSLDMVRLIEDEAIPLWVLPLYLMKAALWAVLLAALPVKQPKRKEEEEPAE